MTRPLRARPSAARLRRLAITLLLALPAAGCKQADGDRCQLNDDCVSGNCLIPAGMSPAQGGTCQSSGNIAPPVDAAMTPADLIPPSDLSMPDVSMSIPDLVTSDLSMPDLVP